MPAVFAAVDADQPPLRLPLSSTAFEIVTGVTGQRIGDWQQWETVSRSADGA